MRWPLFRPLALAFCLQVIETYLPFLLEISAEGWTSVCIGKIPLVRGFSSVFWQDCMIRTGMILIADVTCLLDSVCLAGEDKQTYGHTYCTWTCVFVRERERERPL